MSQLVFFILILQSHSASSFDILILYPQSDERSTNSSGVRIKVALHKNSQVPASALCPRWYSLNIYLRM